MTATLTHSAAEVEPPSAPTRAPRSARWPLPLALGIFGFVAVFVGSWVPSFWGDEAASVMSAERTLPSLLGMLNHVDAVHGIYYLFLHFWIQAFGASELLVRLPGAIAVGIAVAGTFVLGRMLLNRNVGIAAAVVCAVLPRTSYMGADARSYAFSTAVAVWITIVFLVLLRRGFTSKASAWLAWLSYAVGFAAGIYLFLYLGLLLLFHGAFVLTSRAHGWNRRAWLAAAGLTVALSLPIIGIGQAQRGQIAFLAHRGYATPMSVLVTQWFGNPFLAAAGWIMIVVAAVGAVFAWRRRSDDAPLVKLGILWVVLPTIAVLAINMVTPAYDPRYVSFCVPGIALLIAAGIWAIRHRAVRIAAVIVLLVLSVPTDVAQRGPYAKDGGSDLAQASAIIGQNAHPGDAVVFDETTAPRQRPRLALHLYPSDFTGLEDVTIKTPYSARTELWDATYPLADVSAARTLADHVWLLELKGSPDNVRGTDIRTLEADGFSVVSTRIVHRTVIYSLARRS